MSVCDETRQELLNELLAHFAKEHDDFTERLLAEDDRRGAFERGYGEGVWANSIYVLEQLRGWVAEV